MSGGPNWGAAVASVIGGLIALALLIIAVIDSHRHPARIPVWVGVFCTLAIYSILYRENSLFRFFEHIYVGLATGYGVVITVVQVIIPLWGKPLFVEGKWYWVFALLIGAMFYFVFSKRRVWIARWAMGIYFGTGAGLGIVGFVQEFVPQMKASIKPVWHAPWTPATFSVNNLLMFVTLLAVLSYFFFSFEHKRFRLDWSARSGRWLLMIAFGAIFGNTVMARISLLIARLQFLLGDWLHVAQK